MVLYTYAFDDISPQTKADYIKFLYVLNQCKNPDYHEYAKGTYESTINFIDTVIYFPNFEDYLLTEREV